MTQHWADVNGAVLRYAIEGAGPAVVLIHEMGGTLENWDGVVPHLAPRYRVLRYDQRGAGLSEKVRGTLDLDTLVDDLCGLAELTGLDRLALVGGAVGAAVALQHALRFPEKTRCVVALAPALGIPADRHAPLLASIAAAERGGMRAVTDAAFLRSYPQVLRTDLGYYQAFRAKQIANDPASFAATYRMLLGLDIQDRLHRVACPTLVVAGRHDAVRPPDAVAQVAAAIPSARYAVLEAGHFMPYQAPDAVAGLLASFLAETLD